MTRPPGRPAPAGGLARAAAITATVALTVATLTGCGAGKAPARHTVVVLAASSLTESLTAAARDYEKSHPGTDVQLSFASSSTVVTQVNQGAPADLIALAGETAMAPLEKSRIARDGTRTLAANTLEIATPPGNPGKVTTLADLSRPALRVVLCAATVPCGMAAAKALSAAGVVAHVVSYEINVKATLAKVQLGEADAAIVYHSDVVSAGGRVRGVPIPASVNQRLDYPLVRLSEDTATVAFAAYLLSDQGHQRLRDHGFQLP
ncbi:MAG: molybdate ABC transporter substrate-binding protein [Dermatophilaceae bacterium]|nr:molybdate ABC transporter substrate-binding protein [Dermatophilaceae bacterium]